MSWPGPEAGKMQACFRWRDTYVPRPRALKKPDTFEELNSIQHGWSTENEMTDSESGGPVQKESEGSNISQNLGRAERPGTDCPGMEQRPSSAQNWQAASANWL